MTHIVSGFYVTKDGKEKDFSRKFKSEQKALEYFTEKRDDENAYELALTWENEKQILAWEIKKEGKLI